MTWPRRRVLSGFSAAAAAGCRPSTAEQARGTIDTLVFAMMENRSFDHVFGSLSLIEGRTDVDGLTVDHGNLDRDGQWVAPRPTDIPCVEPDPPHDWTSSRDCLGDADNSGFATTFQDHYPDADPSIPLSHHRRADQPISYALADQFVLCDRWFSSLMTSTWPNRLYMHAASSQGMTGNSFPTGGRFTMTALWDRLDEAGISWANYYTDLPTIALFAREDWADRVHHIDAFYADAAAGTLPQVVFVDPGAASNDDHPPHHPMLGQLFISSVVDALATGPQWERCLFALTYDEAGGFFDHVPPGLAQDELASQGFGQLGFRVPAFVVSPWVRPGLCSTDLEHASIPATVLRWFGLEPLTARDAGANDLMSLLDLHRMIDGSPLPKPVLPVLTIDEATLEATCAAAALRSGQPELEDAVRQWRPGLDRSHLRREHMLAWLSRARARGLLA